MSRQEKLIHILNPIKGYLNAVDEELHGQLEDIEHSHTQTNTLSRHSDKALKHSFKTHGKRLRPALMIFSAYAAATQALPDKKTVVKLATAVEIIHTASLVHDDVIDESIFRRGRFSTNARYGNKLAVLSGDILLTQFYTIVSGLTELSASTRFALLDLLMTVTRRMCFGEVYEERIRAGKMKVDFDLYIDTIENKTASLMSGCCEAGGIVAEATEDHIQALIDFGRHIGMAYQLLDDLADKDAVFSLKDDISKAAEEHLQAARASLKDLPKNMGSNGLSALVDLLP
ncbi:MAG: polyprenyl synthetase family protein [Alkalispirochaeta sp.]